MRKLRVLSIALLSALLWSLPAEAAQAGPGRVPGGGGPGSGLQSYVPPLVREAGSVRVSLLGLLHTGQEHPGWEFSARTLRDLLIEVEYRDLPPGSHTQRLKLFLPDGALYQQFTTEIATAGPAARGQGRRPQGPSREWERVTTRLPVGGTWITEHALYGRWRLEVYLDQDRQSTTHGTFVLHK